MELYQKNFFNFLKTKIKKNLKFFFLQENEQKNNILYINSNKKINIKKKIHTVIIAHLIIHTLFQINQKKNLRKRIYQCAKILIIFVIIIK